MDRVIIYCCGGSLAGHLAEKAAHELVKQNLAQYALSKNSLLESKKDYIKILEQASEIVALDACSSLCGAKIVANLVSHKNIQAVCLPRQGFGSDDIKNMDESLDELVLKLKNYFSSEQKQAI